MGGGGGKRKEKKKDEGIVIKNKLKRNFAIQLKWKLKHVFKRSSNFPRIRAPTSLFFLRDTRKLTKKTDFFYSHSLWQKLAQCLQTKQICTTQTIKLLYTQGEGEGEQK